MKTKQEIFNIVWNALNIQGEPSVDNPEGGADCTCMYRSHKADGTVLKCAAGHLMVKYHEDYEGQTVFALPANVFDGVGGSTISFLRRLQQAHDSDAEMPAKEWLPRWRGDMWYIARELGLEVPPIPDEALKHFE